MRLPKGQRTIKCAYCGKPKNFLSTWVVAHTGRVCYRCIKAGKVEVFPMATYAVTFYVEVFVRAVSEEDALTTAVAAADKGEYNDIFQNECLIGGEAVLIELED